MKSYIYSGVFILSLFGANMKCEAKDWSIEGSVGAGFLGLEGYKSFETALARGTVLYGERFKFGIEGELALGVNVHREEGFYFEDRPFVIEKKLPRATSAFFVGRFEPGEFGFHGRLGYRDIKVDEKITYDGERVVPWETNAGALEIGVGAIYRFDKEERHGIRLDVGTSYLFDQDDPSFYNGLGNGTVVQAGYSFKF